MVCALESTFLLKCTLQQLKSQFQTGIVFQSASASSDVDQIRSAARQSANHGLETPLCSAVVVRTASHRPILLLKSRAIHLVRAQQRSYCTSSPRKVLITHYTQPIRSFVEFFIEAFVTFIHWWWNIDQFNSITGCDNQYFGIDGNGCVIALGNVVGCSGLSLTMVPCVSVIATAINPANVTLMFVHRCSWDFYCPDTGVSCAGNDPVLNEYGISGPLTITWSITSPWAPLPNIRSSRHCLLAHFPAALQRLVDYFAEFCSAIIYPTSPKACFTGSIPWHTCLCLQLHSFWVA